MTKSAGEIGRGLSCDIVLKLALQRPRMYTCNQKCGKT